MWETNAIISRRSEVDLMQWVDSNTYDQWLNNAKSCGVYVEWSSPPSWSTWLGSCFLLTMGEWKTTPDIPTWMDADCTWPSCGHLLYPEKSGSTSSESHGLEISEPSKADVLVLWSIKTKGLSFWWASCWMLLTLCYSNCYGHSCSS